jgi:MFS family permease
MLISTLFLMPLYALPPGFDAAAADILVGARSIVAMFLSIHTGVLMDRFGTRKITAMAGDPLVHQPGILPGADAFR